MKVKTNSWHYRLMALYKWSKKFGDGDWTMDINFKMWCVENSIDWYRSRTAELNTYKNFLKYMTDTGAYQPVDFCTYWRNVLLYPMIYAVIWAALMTLSVYMLSFMTIYAVAGSVSILVVAVLLLTIFGVIAYGIDNLKEWIKSRKNTIDEKEDGFLTNVKKSLNSPEICTIVEYEKD